MGRKRERGKYGLRIRSYQAGSIYAYMCGVRDNYDHKDAMLTNSMFLNYMKEHGLNVHNEDSTRDIICIEFKYGSRSYKEEIKHLEKLIKTTEQNEKLTKQKKKIRLKAIKGHLKDAEENKDKFDKKNADEIRTTFYNNGIYIDYFHYEDEKRVFEERIKYKMLFRTPGKAKTGRVNFIREELYDVAHNYLWMGIELPDYDAPIVEIGAYSSLITSTIDISIGDHGRIAIKPEEILILKDVASYCNTSVVSIETDQNKECIAKNIDNYPVKNEMFDGQALIDSSIFPKEGNGYILLRQHFTKCAAFCTHIQKYFREYYGDDYEDAYIEDMFGRKVRAKDIKLITTNNAVKWLKFDVSFDDWAKWIRDADNMWGIVKTAHASKFGENQRMSYQMINALDMDSIEAVAGISMDYIIQLKTNNEVFRQYLIDNSNYSNDYRVLVALVDMDSDFYRCDYFLERKNAIIKGYVKNFKSGKVLQNGDNLVIAGSLFAMLMYAVGEDPLCDPTFDNEDGAIQCWTGRFKNNVYLAEFRNPFNSRNNLGYLHNTYHEYFDRYFDLGELVIVVNMNHTDFQDRNNGSDQDSDSLFVTDTTPIVQHAKYCYANYPTIVNNVSQEKNVYSSTMNDFAEVDNKLASSQLSIGASSNLAQLALSYSYNFTDKKYSDAVCILATIAQIAIDSAKRSYDIDLIKEIKRLREVIDIDNNKYPMFWRGIRRGFKTSKLNSSLQCPMNNLFDLKIPKYKGKPMKPISDFFVKFDIEEDNKRKSKKVERLINKFVYRTHEEVNVDDNVTLNIDENWLLYNDNFDELINDLKEVYISGKYIGLMSWLIDRTFGITQQMRMRVVKYRIPRNRPVLLSVLYEINPTLLLRCFSKNISDKN